ncbi:MULTISPECIES: DNA polymerase III subunit alpha [unclassified Nocardiopsis]|uniref:DNA polymerase III subunit alpha n=1 Tax=unclassified Nocardiopsis TaxID=2649073 RepID=UPI00066B4B61|nr:MULTISPECIES: DNA polymerase III subunit alpha [unclassified Nocardiopsis]MBQ1080019.1 DNA polymerase III subunit alpha [Nocardiopsis sp. B62]
MFTHLRATSSFSFRHGTAPPAALVERAALDGQPVVALTDRDGLFGVAEHIRTCEQAGVRPALGVDLALASPEGGRVVLLARGARGWASLCRLVTAVHRAPAPVAVLPEQLTAHHEGLVLLLGPDSDVGRAVAQERPLHARALLTAWRRVGVEIALAPHDHGASGQRRTARDMVRLADEEHLLAVLTNAVRYPSPDAAGVALALDRIRQHAPGGYRPAPRTERAHLATGEEMFRIAVGVCGGDRTRARRLISHTLALGSSCALDPVADLGWGRLHLPDRPEATADLRGRVTGGAALLGLEGDRRADERVRYELEVIARMGLESYFLTVADAAQAIRDKRIRCSARGSAVGSLVVHLLGISAINPLEHGLLFERFCTPSRPGLPDIDLDVESDRRLEAYDAVIASHPGASATVAMMETYRARSALRDAGAALSLPSVEVDRIASVFPRVRASRISETARELPELRNLDGLDSEHVRRLFSLAERLSGLPRHVAMHPCGLVLSDHAMGDRVPTQPSGAGYPMVQADKEDVEHLGLLKLDVLGVRMQSALAHTLDEIDRTSGRPPVLEALPDGDPATAHMVAASNTLGCFQIESPGQRELVSRLRPDGVPDLIADISLFRPGPMGTDMVSAYLGAREGAETPRLPHPDLAPVLAETGGALLFHEQLLHAIDTMTGCGLDRAEAMRRALGTEQGRREVETQVRSLMSERGHDSRTVEETWRLVAAFGNFGFCKAHAAAFALPTYQSAWLKRHFPAAFFAGVMTHDPGMYPRRVLLNDARRMGVRVLGLDLNASQRHWGVERDGEGRWGLRPALADLGALTEAELDRLLAQRPFTGLRDLLARGPLSREALDNLVLAGGLDTLTGVTGAPGAPDRRDVLVHAHSLTQAHHRSADSPGQLSLDETPETVPAGVAAPMSHPERVAEEVRSLGYELSGHRLDEYAEHFARLASTRNLVLARDLHRFPDGARVLVAGVRVCTQTPPTRSGRRVVFTSIEDRSGVIEVVLFSEAQRRSASAVFGSELLAVHGQVRRAAPGALPTITATRALPLSEL